MGDNDNEVAGSAPVSASASPAAAVAGPAAAAAESQQSYADT